MSVYYDLYLEGMFEGRWICLDRFAKKPDGQMVHCPLMTGQSIIRELLDDIDCWDIDLETLSPDVRERFEGAVEESWFRPACRSFDLEAIRVPLGKHEYERYVHKEDLNAFENQELDSIDYWLTEAEYAALDAEERRLYTYHRWDSPWGTFAVKRRLMERVKDAVDCYNREVMLLENRPNRIERIRIIVRVS